MSSGHESIMGVPTSNKSCRVGVQAADIEKDDTKEAKSKDGFCLVGRELYAEKEPVSWISMKAIKDEEDFKTGDWLTVDIRHNIQEPPPVTGFSWVLDPLSEDYARSMGVAHLKASVVFADDDDKADMEQDTSGMVEERVVEVKEEEKMKPIPTKAVDILAQLNPMLLMVRKRPSGWARDVLRMTEQLLEVQDPTHAKINEYLGTIWKLRAEALLSFGNPRGAQACIQKAYSYVEQAPWGVSARFLLDYTLKMGHNFSDTATTAEIATTAIAETRIFGLSYVEANYNENFGPSSTFVSHAWGAPWISLVQAVVVEQLVGAKNSKTVNGLGAFERDEKSAGIALYERASTQTAKKQTLLMSTALDAPSPHPVRYFWIDVFCKNQHNITSDSTEMELRQNLESCGFMMFVLQPLSCPIALSRVWCLFEVLTCVNCKVPMLIALAFDGMREMDDLVMNNRRMQSSLLEDPVLDALAEQRQLLRKAILVQSASAAVPADRQRILDLVKHSVGFDRMNEIVRTTVDWCVLLWQVSTVRAWARQRPDARWEKRVQLIEALVKQFKR